MNGQSTRRDFLKTALVAAPFTPHLLRASQPTTPVAGVDNPSETKNIVEPFNYDGVRLLDGMLKKQYSMGRDYYLGIPDDNILKGFPRRAGDVRAPGKDLGGWISGDSTVITWWCGRRCERHIRTMAQCDGPHDKATGDEAMGEKATYLMLEWAKASSPIWLLLLFPKPLGATLYVRQDGLWSR